MYKYYELEKIKRYFKETGIKIEENLELERFRTILLEHSKSISDGEILKNITRDLRKTKLPKKIEENLKLLFQEDVYENKIRRNNL